MTRCVPIDNPRICHQSLEFNAVALHYRQQHSFDGVVPIFIKRHGLNEKFVRRISQKCHVVRGLIWHSTLLVTL